jgi:hypothetical protein
LDDEIDESLLDHPQSIALHALRALTAGDLETFGADLAKLLLPYSVLITGIREDLALACHAPRRGWNVQVTSPYLPPRLLQAAQPH